jgi:hypothetical protein
VNFLDSETLNMVKDLNVVLSGFTVEEVKPYVQYHALPRVKFKLLTATDTLGRQVFYGRITDLSDPEIQKAAELLLEQVLSVDIVTEGIRAIIARYACAAMTAQLAAQIEAQRDYAKMLEKQADKDLEEFTRSPVLGGVISAIKASVVERFQARSFGLALDVDTTLISPDGASAKTYEGAQANGTVTLYLDGVPLSVPVVYGDTPAKILRKISLMSVQMAGKRQVEIISMDKTDAPAAFSKQVVLDSGIKYFKVTTSVSEATLQNRTTSGVPASVANLALTHTVGNSEYPGIPGLLVGYGSDYVNFQSDLNPVILGDIKNSDFIMPTDPSIGFNLPDILCFNVPNNTLLAQTTAGARNTFKYKISQVVVGTSSLPPSVSSGEQTINIVDGWTAKDLVEAIAKSLADNRKTQFVLAAVLPSIHISFADGTSAYTPAIDFVGFNINQETEVRFMFQVTQMPEGLLTALSTRGYNAQSLTTDADSVVIDAINLGRDDGVKLEPMGTGGVAAAQAISSDRFNTVWAKIKRMIDMGR